MASQNEPNAYDGNMSVKDVSVNIRLEKLASHFSHLRSEFSINLSVYYVKSSSRNEDWWRCIPKIVNNSDSVGCVEITWDKPDKDLMNLISHYRIYLNNVSYKKSIKPDQNKIVIKGLAGGRSYEATIMIFPKDPRLLPQQSNSLVNCLFENKIEITFCVFFF
jgi:hypothetical protein